MSVNVYTVSQVNTYIKNTMERDPFLSTVYIKGEISNYKLHSSGHQYMTLKDEEAVLRAVMFKHDGAKLNFRPEHGMKVIVKGRITVFPRDGQYQLYISNMIPDGVGDLALAFEQLKKKLNEEGLFDPAKKKKIPKYPERIGLITAPTGAAVRDMVRILNARYPLAKIIVCPTLVQGEGAPESICSALGYVNEHKICDVIILGRGGGSMEDLWCFNDESVARAIFNSQIPIISAVGHEPDFTISDFVADLRAATPSNGAELAVPDQMALRTSLKDSQTRLYRTMHTKTEAYRQQINKIKEKPVLLSPLRYFQDKRMLLEFISTKLEAIATHTLSKKKERYAQLCAMLDAMSPLKVLSRGYGITTDANGNVVKNATDVKIGQTVNIKMSGGELGCTVDSIKS